MNRNEFEEYLVLQDKFMDKCNTIASIFAEVVEDFMYADNWSIEPSFETCTGFREIGYVYCKGCLNRVFHIPFQYIYMTEDELKDVVKNHPEQIRAMVCVDDYWESCEPDDLSYVERELDEGLAELEDIKV